MLEYIGATGLGALGMLSISAWLLARKREIVKDLNFMLTCYFERDYAGAISVMDELNISYPNRLFENLGNILRDKKCIYGEFLINNFIYDRGYSEEAEFRLKKAADVQERIVEALRNIRVPKRNKSLVDIMLKLEETDLEQIKSYLN